MKHLYWLLTRGKSAKFIASFIKWCCKQTSLHKALQVEADFGGKNKKL